MRAWCGGPRGGCDRCQDEARPELSCRSVALAGHPLVEELPYMDGLPRAPIIEGLIDWSTYVAQSLINPTTDRT